MKRDLSTSARDDVGHSVQLREVATLQLQGRHDDAIALCDAAVERWPSASEFLNAKALSLLLTGRVWDAVEVTSLVLDRDPQNVRASETYALLCLHFREYEKAIELATAVLAVDRRAYDAWIILARSLVEIADHVRARAAAEAAIEIAPTRHDGYVALAEALWGAGRLDDAWREFEVAVSFVASTPPEIALRRLVLASEMDDQASIERLLPVVLGHRYSAPECVEIVRIQAMHMHVTRRTSEAVRLLRDAIEILPPSTALEATLGVVIADSDLHEAEQLFARTSRGSDHPSIRFCLSLCQLARGDLAAGYDNYEARWRGSSLIGSARSFAIPQWRGESLKGRRLLVWGEQGIGDQVRFASMLPEIGTCGAEVTLECTPKLVPVFRAAFPWARVESLRPPSEEDLTRYDGFDYEIAMGSLPRLLRPDIGSFLPAKAFLPRNAAGERRWRRELGRAGGTLVGLCWRSGTLKGRRNLHYLPARCLAPLAGLRDTRFVALQYDVLPSEVALMRELGLDVVVPEGLDQKNDLLGALDVIGACDVVISGAISVGELAGGLGVPRISFGLRNTWTFLGQKANPWFPSNVHVVLDPAEPTAAMTEIVDRWEELCGEIGAESGSSDRAI